MFLFFLFFFFVHIATSYLTPPQTTSIQRLLKNPHLTEQMKQDLKRTIFANYIHWINKECSHFCESNPALLSYVHFNSAHKKTRMSYVNEELRQDMYVGFVKALHKFNGNLSTITHYSRHYMKGEIYKGITVATRQRRYKEFVEKNRDSLDNKLQKHKQEKIAEINKIINDPIILSLDERRLINYRYDLQTMKKLRSIRQVCEIFGFSEETYRKRYNTILSKISSAAKNHNYYL